MDFKKLSEVAKIEEVSDESCVLVEENGVIKRAPKTAVGGNGKYDMVIEWDDYEETCNIVSGTYKDIYDKIMNGEDPKVLVKGIYDYYGRCISMQPCSCVLYLGYDDDNLSYDETYIRIVGFCRWDYFTGFYIYPDGYAEPIW